MLVDHEDSILGYSTFPIIFHNIIYWDSCWWWKINEEIYDLVTHVLNKGWFRCGSIIGCELMVRSLLHGGIHDKNQQNCGISYQISCEISHGVYFGECSCWWQTDVIDPDQLMWCGCVWHWDILYTYTPWHSDLWWPDGCSVMGKACGNEVLRPFSQVNHGILNDFLRFRASQFSDKATWSLRLERLKALFFNCAEYGSLKAIFWALVTVKWRSLPFPTVRPWLYAS